jgi:hypothetical protein
MKTIIGILVGLCLATGANAQESETITITPVKKGEEPKAVMDAIRNDFPKGMIADLNFLPLVLYGEQWSVRTEGNVKQSDNVKFYQVNIKEGPQSYQAVYDKHGKLHYSKRIIKHAELPQAVVDAITVAHPDYKIINDREKITSDPNGKLNIVYHVTIQKKEHGILRGMFVDPTGKILREIHPYKV